LSEKKSAASLYQPKMSGSILDRFRAGMNEKASIRPVNAANDFAKTSFQEK
jgi:hypothetical protein